MKKIILIFSLILTLSFAGEMDILLDKLIKKGVITEKEAKEIQDEIKKDKEEQVRKEKYSFLKNSKFSGDVRLRYQHEDIEGTSDRERGRIRVRWGFKTEIGEDTEIGLRLATGTGEQTSTNQTFMDAFSQKSFYLDRAYFKHKIGDFNIIGGKMENPFFCTDVIWDSDINPEGIALTFTRKNGFFANLGYFFLDEFKDMTDDPLLYGIQFGYKGKIAERDFKIATGIYMTDNLKGEKRDDISPNYKPSGNTLDKDGKYIYEYKPWDILFEVNLFEISGKPIKIFAEYVNNIESDVKNDDTAYILGFIIGRLKEKGDWQFEYNYRKIESDAVLAILCDSDINGGGSSLKGHKLSLGYQLTKNSSLGITYFIGKSIAPRKDERNTLQLDYLIKF